MSIYKGIDNSLKRTIFTLNSFMDENFIRERGRFRSDNRFCGVKNNLEVYIIMDRDKIKKVSIYSELDLGNYYNEDDYDFLSLGDENILDINRDNLKMSTDFKNLIEKKFRNTSKEEVCGYPVEVNFSAETGDKNSLYISKELSVSLSGYEHSYELLDVIKSLIKSF